MEIILTEIKLNLETFNTFVDIQQKKNRQNILCRLRLKAFVLLLSKTNVNKSNLVLQTFDPFNKLLSIIRVVYLVIKYLYILHHIYIARTFESRQKYNNLFFFADTVSNFIFVT